MTMTRSRYDASKPNHVKTCERTACAEKEPHEGGRHLDQRDELYDGPGSVLGVLPVSVNESARKILREAPELMPELMDLAHEIEFLRDQVAAVSVDKDRQVREAMRRSESCEHHGEEIRDLSESMYAADQHQRRTEAGRLVMLGFFHAVQKAVEDYGRDQPVRATLKAFMEVLAGAVKKAGAAHDRAWKS